MAATSSLPAQPQRRLQCARSCVLLSPLPLAIDAAASAMRSRRPRAFQGLALDARYDTSNEPARQAHLNDRNQRAVRLEGGEGSAQVVQLLHGVAPSVHISDDGMQYPRRRPIASSIMGFEDGVDLPFGM